jgi:hypothetical protein
MKQDREENRKHIKKEGKCSAYSEKWTLGYRCNTKIMQL